MRPLLSSGIALGPILFIIAILAIIAVAIAAGASSFHANTPSESAKIQAATIIRVAESLQAALQTVYVGHSCPDTSVNFNNPIIIGYSNPNAPADGSCDVFGDNGGHMPFPIITASTLETTDKGYFVFEGSMNFVGIGSPYSTPYPAPSSSLAGFLPIDSLALCQAINIQVGQAGNLGWGFYWNPSDVTAGHFYGGYFSYNSLPDAGGVWPNGQMMGCLQQGNSGVSPNHTSNWYPFNAPYFFYVVLLPR